MKHKSYDWTGYSDKERVFCYEYIIDRHQINAAKRAGYSPKSAQQIGTKVYKKCKDRISEMLSDLTISNNVTVDKVIQELAKIGFMNAKDFFDNDGNPIAIQNLSDDAAATIAGMKVNTQADDEGEVSTLKEYKLADKLDALRLLGQNLQMFSKKLIIDDKRPVVVVKDMTGRKKKAAD